ncbi:MAG: TPM domain-containing protein [Symploca sp. SIO1A3]|nr:TPM domain-containing protein [Symploca sp. SIO1A3]
MAEILSDDTEAQLNQLISGVEAKNGTEIAVVTVPETGLSESPKAFTTALFNHWGIGKQGQNNGILFLVSQSEHRVEIETGYGVAKILPDAEVAKIIDTQIIPQFKQGNFDAGTLAGTQSLIAVLQGGDTGIFWVIYTIVGGFGLALVMVIGKYVRRRPPVATQLPKRSLSQSSTYKPYTPKSSTSNTPKSSTSRTSKSTSRTSKSTSRNRTHSRSRTSYYDSDSSSSSSSHNFGGGSSGGSGADGDYSSSSSSSSDFGGGGSSGDGGGGDW